MNYFILTCNNKKLVLSLSKNCPSKINELVLIKATT